MLEFHRGFFDVCGIHLRKKGPKQSTDGCPEACETLRTSERLYININVAVCQNLVPLVNIKIADKWMFIPLKMVLIGIDPYPYLEKASLGFSKKRKLSGKGCTKRTPKVTCSQPRIWTRKSAPRGHPPERSDASLGWKSTGGRTALWDGSNGTLWKIWRFLSKIWDLGGFRWIYMDLHVKPMAVQWGKWGLKLAFAAFALHLCSPTAHLEFWGLLKAGNCWTNQWTKGPEQRRCFSQVAAATCNAQILELDQTEGCTFVIPVKPQPQRLADMEFRICGTKKKTMFKISGATASLW